MDSSRTINKQTDEARRSAQRPALVILTGASGSGKTTLAQAVRHKNLPRCEVASFDSVGIPSVEAMRAFGDGYQPGGAWQRATTIRWIERIATVLHSGNSLLFEGQMRIAFVREAVAMTGIEWSHIILVDCDDVTRAARLGADRNQPELANADMMAWSRYLRQEAALAGCEIMDTGAVPFEACVDHIVLRLTRK